MTRPAFGITVLAAALSGAACAPALDWREFVPEGTDLRVTFPCRPDRSTRFVAIATKRVAMTMLACNAGATTFALAFADVAEPAGVGAELVDLRRLSVANVRGGEPQRLALRVPGMTPNDATGRIRVAGRLPDGAAVREEVAVFARGLRVYQAATIGAAPPAEATDAFFAGLTFTP